MNTHPAYWISGRYYICPEQQMLCRNARIMNPSLSSQSNLQSRAREQNWVVVLHNTNEMEYSNKCSYAILYYPPLWMESGFCNATYARVLPYKKKLFPSSMQGGYSWVRFRPCTKTVFLTIKVHNIFSSVWGWKSCTLNKLSQKEHVRIPKILGHATISEGVYVQSKLEAKGENAPVFKACRHNRDI